MKIIGITGGVGSGKSRVLEILRDDYHAFALEADKAAHTLMRQGGLVYRQIVDAFGREMLAPDGEIDRRILGGIVFASKEKLDLLNHITHPAVREHILGQIDAYAKEMPSGIFALEAALLIEEGYADVCDELWYVYVDRDTRMKRLMEGRGYTRDKCIAIFDSQSDENYYRTHCRHIIDNCGNLEKTKIQIDNLLKN